jgi:hypothetical protein
MEFCYLCFGKQTVSSVKGQSRCFHWRIRACGWALWVTMSACVTVSASYGFMCPPLGQSNEGLQGTDSPWRWL